MTNKEIDKEIYRGSMDAINAEGIAKFIHWIESVKEGSAPPPLGVSKQRFLRIAGKAICDHMFKELQECLEEPDQQVVVE